MVASKGKAQQTNQVVGFAWVVDTDWTQLTCLAPAIVAAKLAHLLDMYQTKIGHDLPILCMK